MQRRSRLKREALLRAGVETFRRKGYEAASIAEIARRAKVAVGGFYQHFRSKRQLLLVLMDDLLRNLDRIDTAPAGATIRDRLESVLRAGLSTDVAYAGAYRAWKEAILSEPELALVDQQVRRWTTGRLVALFEDLRRIPGSRRDFDLRLFVAALDRIFWDLVASDLIASARLVETLGHVIVHSVFTDQFLATEAAALPRR